MQRILIIEDDLLLSRMVQYRLKKDGYETILVQDGNEGIKAIEEEDIDLIITDVILPFKSGIEIIHHARKFKPDAPIIVLSSLGAEEQIVLEAFNLGVADFVPKPFNPNELAVQVRRVYPTSLRVEPKFSTQTLTASKSLPCPKNHLIFFEFGMVA